MSMEDDTRVERTRGTPQGGVVSPVLANLFPHYAFDPWMTRTHLELPWCRYADDGLVHYRNEQEAQAVMATLQARLAECHLEMHPTKTKIVYCKDGSRKGSHVNQGFDFLGYGFRPRLVKNSRRASLFWSFTPAVSQTAVTAMRETIRKTNLRDRTQITLEDVANEINPVLRGWIVSWTPLSLGAVSGVPPCQQDVGGMGHAEVQTPFRTQDAGRHLPRDHPKGESASLRTLAERYYRRVRLMGAV
jgi:RNA-directed DNA polymerase